MLILVHIIDEMQFVKSISVGKIICIVEPDCIDWPFPIVIVNMYVVFSPVTKLRGVTIAD